MRDGFKSNGEVHFLGATIGRNLECDGAQLSNPNGRALNADGAKIDGSVFLRNGFKSKGEINLLGATIGGSLSCIGAQLSNPNGRALNADGAKIDGSVFLRNGFKAKGEVNLLVATIGKNLDCDGAQLSNPDGRALDAAGAKIDSYVFLRNGFKSQGEVNLLGTTVGGNLECIGAQLSNPSGIGLEASGIKIAGSVWLTGGFKANGGVRLAASEIKGYLRCYKILATKNTWFELRSAKIGTLRDEKKSWPVQGELFLDGFTYDRISEESPLTAKNRIEWLHRQAHDKFLPQPYEQIASVLRNMGHEREARRVMIQKNQDHANFTKRFSQEWWWYNVFGWLIGYGYAPSRAFFISLGMIALGWGLFRLGFVKKLILPTDEKGYKKDESGKFVRRDGERTISDDYPKFNGLIFSLESFTPLLKLDQSSNWAPNAKCGAALHFWRVHLTTGSLLRIYLWFHIMAGWVLTSLWVGGITGLVKS